MVQISSIAFAAAANVTSTDVFRVYINGVEYNTAAILSNNIPADIINDLVSRINNDPAQLDVLASSSGFGLRLEEG